MGLRFAAATHIGKVRKLNQDRYLIKELDDGSVVVLVADGMGGHVAGEVASALAIQAVWEELQKQSTEMSIKTRLIAAIQAANARIYAEASANETYAGMGTTIVAVIARPETLWVAHVGDSRAYLMEEFKKLHKLTEDHTLVNELIRRGKLLPEEAENHPQRHMLTQALGTSPDVSIEYGEWNWQLHDRLLVCTDGLTSHLRSDAIFALLQKVEELPRSVDALLNAALATGGYDNITLVLVANESSERRSQE